MTGQFCHDLLRRTFEQFRLDLNRRLKDDDDGRGRSGAEEGDRDREGGREGECFLLVSGDETTTLPPA